MRDVQPRENVIQSTTNISSRQQILVISSSLTISLDLICPAQRNYHASLCYPWCFGWTFCLQHSTAQCKCKAWHVPWCCIPPRCQKVLRLGYNKQEHGLHLPRKNMWQIMFSLGASPVSWDQHCSLSLWLVAGLNSVLELSQVQVFTWVCVEPSKLLGLRDLWGGDICTPQLPYSS